MTFLAESKKSGRRYVKYFEVDPDECVQEWGVGACAPAESKITVLDTLTDTNGTLLQNHVSDSGIGWLKTIAGGAPDWTITNNRIEIGASGGSGSYYHNYAGLVDNQYVQADVTLTTATGTAIYVAIRVADPADDLSDRYYLELDTGLFRLQIWKQSLGATGLVATVDLDPIGAGVQFSMRLEAVGSTLNGYINGNLKVTGTDSSVPTGGYTALYGFTGSTGGLYIDNFSSYYGETASKENACFNTRSTCQYSQAYIIGTRTDRFFESTEDAADLGLDGIPLLEKAKTEPTRLNPGKGIGVRAELSVTLNDTRHHDRGYDPYAEFRTYDAMTQGTFWGKWLARNKYYTGRTVRLYEGFLTDAGYDAANFRVREYIITKIDRTKSGVTFKCGDILQKLNTAVAPPPSYVYLTSGITDAQTTIGIDTTGEAKLAVFRSDGTAQYIEPFAGSLPFYRADSSPSFIPLTAGNELPFYRADGSSHPIPLVSTEFPIGETVAVRIGSELISGTIAAGQITGCTRGYRGSDAAAHVAGDTVQKCIEFNNTIPTDALTTLFTYAGIQSYINTTTWDDQASKWLGLYGLDGIISAPEKITSIVERVCVQGTVYIWWDDFTQKIELLAVAPQAALSTLTTYTDELNIIEGSASSEANMREQVTQVLVWYDKINEADDNSAKNMNLVYPAFDSGAESATQWGLSRTEQIECDFVKATGHASAIGSRIIGRLRDGEQIIKFQTDIKEPLKTGDEFIINTDASQAADGSQESVRMQVIEMKEMKGGKMYYEAVKSAFQGTRYAFIAPDTVSSSYAIATEEERSQYAFISNAQGYMSDGTKGYSII